MTTVSHMDFIAARDLDEALEAKAASPESELLAGGTDLMVEVNLAHHRPASIISLRRIDELRTIQPDRIGAGMTWAELDRGSHMGLAQAARTVGSPQIRATGTLGGNIGTASPAGDGLPWIAAANAAIAVQSKARGERVIQWDEFFLGVKQTALEPDEIITAVVIPEDTPPTQAFAKVGTRNAMVISTVSCLVMRGGDGFRIALGSVAPTPIRMPRAEQVLNAERSPSQATLEEVQRIVSEDVTPISDHRSTEGYRRHAAGVLAKRLVERCLA